MNDLLTRLQAIRQRREERIGHGPGCGGGITFTPISVASVGSLNGIAQQLGKPLRSHCIAGCGWAERVRADWDAAVCRAMDESACAVTIAYGTQLGSLHVAAAKAHEERFFTALTGEARSEPHSTIRGALESGDTP